MNTYVALLRGINVGGHKKVPMAELRELLTNTGLLCVRTYIQSGNIVFESAFKNCDQLENLIAEAIRKGFGYKIERTNSPFVVENPV